MAEFLDGQFLSGGDQSDQLLDNFLIGGLVLDWGPFYFATRTNTGVIVRGDRPDVQLAAIQTDTTRALLLTKGVRPVEYVIYEAGQRGIPLIVVPGSTHDVAEKLGKGPQPQVGFDHEDKLHRMVELVSEHLESQYLKINWPTGNTLNRGLTYLGHLIEPAFSSRCLLIYWLHTDCSAVWTIFSFIEVSEI
ncbi:MAG: hypothetical protein Ct9H300mP19_04330 [Dehalococcoidia bacterium]|nr:MAG: hypothetical protein Ct9H300mP19_04330 [Dehalococcoidia bacterium]